MSNYSQQLHIKYEKFWSNMAPKFSIDPGHYSSRKPYPSMLEFIKILNSDSSVKHILDIGCGNSRNLFAFGKNKFLLTGIDISNSAIKFSSKIAKTKKITNIELINADYLAYNFRKNFDAVIDSGFFHHLRKSQWHDYLSRLNKILNKDGYYYLLAFSEKTPHIKQFGKRVFNYSKRNNHYYHYFNANIIRTIFSESFKVIKIFSEKRQNSQIVFEIALLKKR